MPGFAYVPPSAIPELLQRQAENRARFAQQQGDITGRLWANLGDRIAAIPGEIAAAKAQQQQQALRQSQIDEAQTAAKAAQARQTENTAIDGLMKSALTQDPETGAVTYDRNTLAQGFGQLGIGHLWPQYQELIDKSDASLKTVKDAHKSAIQDVARLVQASGNDSTVFANELMRGVHNGLFTQQEAAPYLEAAQRDPSHVGAVTSSILGKTPELMTVKPGESVVDKTNPSGGAVYTAPADAKVPNSQEADFNLDGKNVKGSYVPGVNGQPGRYFYQGQDVTGRAGHIAPERDPIAQQLAQDRLEQQRQANAPIDLASNVRTTLSGQKYVDLGDFESAGQRQKARDAAKQAGVPVVDKDVGQSLAAADLAKQNLTAMLAQIRSHLPTDPAGRLIGGPENKLAKYFQTDSDLAAFNSWRAAAIQSVQALVEKGLGFRMNQAEINMIMQNDMPQLTDTVGTAQQRINNVLTLLNNKESTALTKDRSALAPKGDGGGPKVGDRRVINGQLGEWDGHGWKAVQ